MLRIRQSNRLDRLADDLIAGLAAPTWGHPLEMQRVVVQSPGMATWLRHRLAGSAGIAAAVEFPLPATLIWRLVRALLPETEEQSPYDKRAMVWRLLPLLAPSALEGVEVYAPLAGYLHDDDSGLKRFQLAQRIADVFDQYLIYRPDWMDAWRAGRDEGPPGRAAPWQPRLWRALVAACGGRADRARLQTRALERLEQDPAVGDCVRQVLGARLSVFGISALPPEQLRVLLAAAAHVDIDLHVFNPCRAYWSDIVSERWRARLVADETARDEPAPTHPYYESGHPLLASLGRAGRDFVDLVLELGEHGELEDAFVTPVGDGVLPTLQRDLLDLVDDGQRLPLADGDDSLVFADCHGALREVEALHDWLLARFEADPTLHPRDVVVMIPDIDRYAPCVEAVFGRAAFGRAADGRAAYGRADDGVEPLQIPFGISDRGAGREAPILGTLAALLRLPGSRLTASEVLGILEAPAVLRRFDLDESDLEQIVWWVGEAGVRWGRDAAHWRQLGLAPADSGDGPLPNTWTFGTERLLLGYATGAGAPFRDRLPIDGVEGSAAAALGGLLSFLDALAHHARRLEGSHSAADWALRLEALLADLLAPDAAEAEALEGVRELIGELAELDAEHGLSGTLSADVVEAALAPVLSAPGGSHRFLGGQVTFCTLMPMRTVPFRVVALLGMNDADYPRRDVPLGFDLLARFPRKGDRARRLEDRFLFLEALLAARDHLYVSHTGRSPADDAVQPPSVVVAELRDAVDRRFLVPGDEAAGAAAARTLRHRLQPFSAGYGPDGLVTYSPLWARARDVAPQPQPAPPEWPPRTPDLQVPLAALTGYLIDPAGRFLAERLDVRLDETGLELEDDEPFVLSGLERYRTRAEALRSLRAGESARAWLQRERIAGRVPHGAAGTEALAAAEGLLRDYAVRAGPLVAEPVATLPVRVQLGERTLEGDVGDCIEGERLVLRPGSAGPRDHLRLWVAHLALAASGQGRRSLLIDRNAIWCLEPIAEDAAQARLADLIALRDEGLDAPLPLLVEGSEALAVRFDRDADVDAALKAARGTWQRDWGPLPGEGEQAAVARLWPTFPGDDPALRETFVALSLRVWAPLLAARTTLDPEAVADG